MPYGDPISFTRCEANVEKQTREMEQLEDWLTQKYRDERQAKADLERRKSDKMFELMNQGNKGEEGSPERPNFNKNNRERKAERQQWLRDVYVPELRNIGISRQKLDRLIGEGGCPYEIRNEKIYETGSDIPIVNIHTGNDAFESVAVDGSNLSRPVFQKKGKKVFRESTEKTQYIRDDLGRVTRRYAYVEKAWDVFELIMLRDATGLPGREVNALHGNPKFASPRTAGKWGTSGGAGADLSDRELAFINQEQGSSVQRGHPLASTPKHLHGNEGHRFGKRDGVILKIDLARISPVADDQLLLNLYSYDAQTDDQDGTIGLTQYRTKKDGNRRVQDGNDVVAFTAQQMKNHTDTSTSKNRELFLLKFPKRAVVAVLCHDKNKVGDVEDLLDANGQRDVAIEHQAHAARDDNELY